MRLPAVAGALALAAPVLLAAPPASAVTPPAVLSFVPVATGLAAPTQVTSAPGIRDRLYVTELPGTIRTVDPVTGTVSATPYLDLTADVLTGGERGLLGLAFAADFATSGRLYVTFTRDDPADLDDGAVVLRRITVADPTAAVADVTTSTDLLSIPHPLSNHNGGGLAWDAQGRLLVSTGDGGGGGDPDDNARDRSSLLGKVLRLDVGDACAPRAYCIPPDNPFAVTGGAPEVWLWGVRNPWRIATDPVTGTTYVADVGQGRWEEVTVLPAGTPGRDLQWSCREGLEVFDATRCSGDPADQAVQLAPTTVTCHPSVTGCAADDTGTSVTGGQVYRGSRYAAVLDGVYVFGDFGSGNVWTLVGDTRTRVGSLPGATSFGTDADGELWATTIGGDVVRLDVPGFLPPTTPPAPTDAPVTTAAARLVPARVQAVAAERTGRTRLVVRWTAPAGPPSATGYRVQSRRPGTGWRLAADDRPASPTRWRWRDAPRRVVAVRVAAVADGVRGPWSQPARVGGSPAG